MKAKIKETPQDFKPVTIEITFETQIEFENFRNMMGNDSLYTEQSVKLYDLCNRILSKMQFV